MKILVTGATSLLGSAVVSRLLERGDDVRTMQRTPSGFDCEEHLANLTDAEAVAAAVIGCDAVVHLAAKVGIVGRWSDFASVNVIGTTNVLLAARDAGVCRFVQVSSPSVAHTGESLVGATAGPATPERTRGHYAKSKAEAEIAALSSDSPDLAVVAVRPHLVWGPGDTQLVGRMVDRARSGRLAVVGSGTALIDTTYIDNAADALVAALDRCEHVHGRSFVVSNGQPRPVAELVSRIVTCAGFDPPTLNVPRRVALAAGLAVERTWAWLDKNDDPPMTRFLAEQLSTAHWFDQRKTRKALRWTPQISIDQGLQRLADWYRSGPPSQVAEGA